MENVCIFAEQDLQMGFTIVEIPMLSGDKCRIFSVQMDGDDETLYEQFSEAYYDEYADEVEDIYDRLRFIGCEGGARPQFFKDKEGAPGDGVSALYDNPDHKLRLYCIVYGRVSVILGGGGPKPKHVRRWQDDPVLCNNAELMKRISRKITDAIRNGDIKVTDSGLSGNLRIDDYGE